MEPESGSPAQVRSAPLSLLGPGLLLLLVVFCVLDSRTTKEPLLVAPLQPERWLALAQERVNQGKLEEAKALLAQARKQAGPLSSHRLQAATLAVELGELPEAFRDLRLVFRTDPDLRRQAAYLAKSTWGEEGGYRLVPPGDSRLLAAYLELSLEEHWLADAAKCWERAEREKIAFDPTLVRRYVEVLWEADQLSAARKIWKRLYGGEGIVWNGGFEEDLVGWGFGWKTRPQTGVGIRRDEKTASSGKASLRIRLAGLPVDGDHLLAEQTLLLSPGSHYELRAKGKSEEITSSSGLVIEIADGETGTVWASTPVLTGTTDWTEFTVPVDVPPGSGLAALQIKWKGTSEWEVPVYGTAWWDELEIIESGPPIEFKGATAAPSLRAP
ncbi:hypothetical protein MAMC_01857 [Methylacidimicrobium cyclopophantes]|uniref:CBM-cenC domain-containing protein n=1 Tax=Methylacidimicrobium cyclopophantes TaxID=1041766 RepID=A0A5E6MF21_9BACT|nr:hypothetical protein [Methylacidimicrobium cyclopophantes]VVM07839.1 hypothetical protein MAMC_01857 [Methylacidimicrobium cyclopophantes]